MSLNCVMFIFKSISDFFSFRDNSDSLPNYHAEEMNRAYVNTRKNDDTRNLRGNSRAAGKEPYSGNDCFKLFFQCMHSADTALVCHPVDLKIIVH